ncbi:DUF4145 domain-containing protein [Alcaligenes faecalis subsp. phenolicus]|uniref:DUF4145 domain-containing protein n=1 Tax=Alcaligenes nematophilus TaxID=2994643 RepID=UPI002AA3100D|nr:DUF4145 domain-containing protein [Alcaligenes phenolicus]
MDSIKYIKDSTTDLEHDISCSKCSGKTAHKVVSSYDLRGEYDDGQHSMQWAVDHQIIQCLGCKTISFRKASSNSEDCVQTSHDGDVECVVDETIYPSRVDGVKGLGDDTHYLPTSVRRIYDETLQALSNQSPVLAGIGLRALLETVCKEKNATGNDLLKKIDSLVTASVLTPVSAAILHKIRTLGNKAAHEVKPHSDRQLGLAMNIVEHLLKDVYILPKQVESEFGDDV